MMARPYSLDLRERAIARVQADESVRDVAQALNLSPSSVVKELWRILSDEADQAALCVGIGMISVPSWNLTPAITHLPP